MAVNNFQQGWRRKPGSYRRYLQDPAAKIPRKTKRRWLELGLEHENLTENDVPMEIQGCENIEDVAENGSSNPEVLQGETSSGQFGNGENFGANYGEPSTDDYTPLAEEVKLPEEMNYPIFDGSTLTVGEAVFCILQFYFRFSLTKACLQGFLELMQKLLPCPNLLPKSKYSLLKIVDKLSANYTFKKHFYCKNKNCDGHISNPGEIQNKCSNCGTPFGQCDSYFVEFDIESLFRDMMEKECMYKYIRKFTDKGDGIVTDICNGAQYLKLKSDGALNQNHDFSIIFNTDGIPVFNSSSKQMWPIQFIIAELPMNLRKLFLIIGGIYFDKIKPNMSSFLEPFVQTLKKLVTEGFNWIHPVTKMAHNSKVVTILVSVDAVARAPIQNINQFNGSHGCSICEQTGISIPEKHGYVYMPQFDNILRTGKRMKRQAEQAVENGQL